MTPDVGRRPGELIVAGTFVVLAFASGVGARAIGEALRWNHSRDPGCCMGTFVALSVALRRPELFVMSPMFACTAWLLSASDALAGEAN